MTKNEYKFKEMMKDEIPVRFWKVGLYANFSLTAKRDHTNFEYSLRTNF
jgi:hypothetical protein